MADDRGISIDDLLAWDRLARQSNRNRKRRCRKDANEHLASVRPEQGDRIEHGANDRLRQPGKEDDAT